MSQGPLMSAPAKVSTTLPALFSTSQTTRLRGRRRAVGGRQACPRSPIRIAGPPAPWSIRLRPCTYRAVVELVQSVREQLRASVSHRDLDDRGSRCPRKIIRVIIEIAHQERLLSFSPVAPCGTTATPYGFTSPLLGTVEACALMVCIGLDERSTCRGARPVKGTLGTAQRSTRKATPPAVDFNPGIILLKE